MKLGLLLLPLALAAAPAQATSSMLCSTAGDKPIAALLVIGQAAISSVVQASLTDDGREIPVQVAQSWIDQDELRLDLVDPNAERQELRLLAKAKGEGYDGSLWRNGKRRWVRCGEAG
jgi:hypothetical protein